MLTAASIMANKSCTLKHLSVITMSPCSYNWTNLLRPTIFRSHMHPPGIKYFYSVPIFIEWKHCLLCSWCIGLLNWTFNSSTIILGGSFLTKLPGGQIFASLHCFKISGSKVSDQVVRGPNICFSPLPWNQWEQSIWPSYQEAKYLLLFTALKSVGAKYLTKLPGGQIFTSLYCFEISGSKVSNQVVRGPNICFYPLTCNEKYPRINNMFYTCFR